MVKQKDIYWQLINKLGTYIVKNPKFYQNYLRATYKCEPDMNFMSTGLFWFSDLKSLSPINNPEIVFNFESSKNQQKNKEQSVPSKPQIERLEYVNKRERQVLISIKRNQLVEEIEFALGEIPPDTPLYDMYMTDDEDTLILVFKEEEYISEIEDRKVDLLRFLKKSRIMN